jgi:acetolactate synthase-1/2/3 large subunit
LTSTRQKGLVPPSHPYCAGTFLNGRLERELLAQSDLALLVDPEAFDFYNRPWAFDAEAVAIVADDFTEWMNPFSELVVADPSALLGELTARAATPVSSWTPADVSGYQERVRARLLGSAEGAEATVPAGTVAGGMSVPAAVAAALDVFPQDGFLTADAGFSKPILAMLSRPSLPNRFLASNGLSTMGFSIPAALAVSRTGVAPVAAFMGDGSLLMRATELAAGAEGLPVPLVAVAIVDRALTQIAVKQERRELETVGTALPPLVCALLAQGLGIDGVDVDNAADLSAAVSSALQRRRPTLIGAVVDPEPSRSLFELMRG